MSLARKAARGALWTIASSMTGRAVGLIGTLVMTRFLHPAQIGEVSDAAILCMTANWLTIWGFGQYSVVKARGDAATATEVTWHATVFYIVLGVIALGLVALLGGRLTPLFDAPHAAIYVPGMALAIFIRRLGAMPERMLTMRMDFRPSGIALALGELIYTASALTFAALGWGGMAIVIANIIQSLVVVAILIGAAGLRSWTTPAALRWSRIKDMLRYGVPLGVQGTAHAASRYWDNLAVSHFFGPAATGAYNMAYNIADVPAVQVGEQIALVLLPSMAELPRERRAAALERSSALLSVVIFPLAMGLGLIAYPLIAAVLPANEWQEVAPLLAVLACLSVFRPITWVLSAYLEAEQKTNRLMILELAKLALLIGGIAALAPYGLRVAAAAVGLAFGTTAIAGVMMVAHEGPSPTRLLEGFLRPLAACAVMATVVLGVHRELEGPIVQLVVEIVVGGVVYVAAALVICRETTRDLLQLLGRATRREPRGDDMTVEA